jgi:hypothetical protein
LVRSDAEAHSDLCEVLAPTPVLTSVDIAPLDRLGCWWSGRFGCSGTADSLRVVPDCRAARILTAVWGLAFSVDALIQVAVAYTLPIDLVPGVSTAQWLVVLGCTLLFHIVYTKRKDLRA